MCCSVNADTFAMCRHGAVLISAAVQNDELDIKAESFLVPRNKSDKDALLMGGWWGGRVSAGRKDAVGGFVDQTVRNSFDNTHVKWDLMRCEASTASSRCF